MALPDEIIVSVAEFGRSAETKYAASLDGSRLAYVGHTASLGGWAARARLALFAREGFGQRLQVRAAEENVLLLTAADLFA